MKNLNIVESNPAHALPNKAEVKLDVYCYEMASKLENFNI